MAQTAEAPRPTLAPNPPPAERTAAPLSVVTNVNTDIEADAQPPTVGVPRGPILIALGAAIWFVGAVVFLFAAGDAFADYPLVIVAAFAVIFFGLTVGLARRAARNPRWATEPRATLADFLEQNVAIETGTISGRAAMVQIITLPIVLAAGATLIGIVFLMSG